MKIRSFEDLTVWQEAHQLALYVYRLTQKFPSSERFGLVSQLQRAASSVSANIAEGFGRGTPKELLRSLQIARGSLEETRYFLILSRDLGHISPADFVAGYQRCHSVGRLINALGTSLKRRMRAGLGTPSAGIHQSPVTSY